MPPSIQLTPEEMATVGPFFAAADARAQGYAEAMEAAKRMLIQLVISNRQAKPEQP